MEKIKIFRVYHQELKKKFGKNCILKSPFQAFLEKVVTLNEVHFLDIAN